MADRYRYLSDIFHGIDSYAVYTQSGIDQGQMMQWDSVARKAVNNAIISGSIFLGISEESQPLRSLGTATAPLTGDKVRIRSQGLMELATTASETYAHLDAVYPGANPSTVTTVPSNNRIIARVHLPDGTTVTGGTGVIVPVKILGSMTNLSTIPTGAAGGKG